MEANMKQKDLYPAYDGLECKRVLEEHLKEVICFGDTDGIQELINLGVDVNTRHSVNGWTPLHWACKRGSLDVAALLLKNGADKTIRSETGETPMSVCANQQVLQLLNSTAEQRISNESTSSSSLHNLVPAYSKTEFPSSTVDSGHAGVRSNTFAEPKRNSLQDELVLKIRIANTPDPDFVEIELPQNDLTYQSLLRVCCEELSLSPNNVLKLRKLPNTKLRKDKDIHRLQNFEEIEVVLDSTTTYKYTQNSNGIPVSVSTVPTNGYQSMSKKDQIILY